MRIGVCEEVFHLLGILLQQPLQVAGHVIGVKGGLAVSEGLLSAVIARDDDKAGAAVGAEHIVVGAPALDRRWLGMCQSQSRAAAVQCGALV